MNCPSRNDETLGHNGWNQSPGRLSADTTTRQDLNGIANAREQREHGSKTSSIKEEERITEAPFDEPAEKEKAGNIKGELVDAGKGTLELQSNPGESKLPHRGLEHVQRYSRQGVQILTKYVKFIGPGFMIAVAYIDPGNYATDVAAGSATKFSLLFIVLMSNLFAIFLQSLCIKLGTVTGLNLAENCRAHLPRWLVWILYLLAEAAIIATDIAEVIGTAIALNLLLHIPLVGGCAISIVDVLIILLFYSPDGSVKRLRFFEMFVMALVLGVVVCFCIQLSLLQDTSIGEVFRGYLPSSAIVQSNGLYLSCGILGATVMPHSIFLGSGVVQPRLRHFDIVSGHYAPSVPNSSVPEPHLKYRPSIHAIKSCLKYSIVELSLSLFTFALFVNSAILIVAGASLSDNPEASENADLFSIYALLNRMIGKGAGTLFALALLLSGSSAGIVCTIAGQMVSEGMLNWTLSPWVRRLLTRSISITPSIIIAGAVGRTGLSAALTASQVVLSIILPFVTAPLIYFTCRERYMTVSTGDTRGEEIRGEGVVMRNGWVVSGLAVLIWLVIAVMNVALLVLVGMGKA